MRIETRSSSFVLELEIPASVDQLWNAWTENKNLTQWLTSKANVQAEPDGAYELFWEPDHPERNSTLGCQVLEVREKELLKFNWKGPVPFADLMNVEPLPTFVQITFRKTGANVSSVQLEHFGWGKGERWDEARAWQFNAWRGALQALKEQLKA